jgi:hypothetical protein
MSCNFFSIIEKHQLATCQLSNMQQEGLQKILKRLMNRQLGPLGQY